MNILIAAATMAEISPLLRHLEINRVGDPFNGYISGDHHIRVCITGVGSAPAAYHLGKALMHRPTDLAVQAGIAGSFSHDIPLGGVFRIGTDVFADLGAENDGLFLDLFDLGLLQPGDPPFSGRELPAPRMEAPVLGALPWATAITVNTVTGSRPTLDKWVEKYHPDLESMEGAAFHYVCGAEKVTFAQIRSVSNYVEVRDKSQWDIPRAVSALNETLIRLIDTIHDNETSWTKP